MAETPSTPGPRRRVARTRGAGSGILLVLLGAWGALIPFIGPYFNFSFTPDKAWTWSQARGWLEVLPGAATFVGGLLLLLSTSRMMTLVGAWLAVACGAWFVVGPQLETTWNIGSPGLPAGSSDAIHVAESLAMFYALGAVILFLASAAFGRLSVVSPRDVRASERRQAAAVEELEAQEARDAELREAAVRDAAARDAAQRREPMTQPPTNGSDPSTASDAPRHEASPQEPSGYQGDVTGSYWSQQNRYPSQSTSDPNVR
ncbi:MAG TPA: hypothetical protein VFE19_14545 [Jatrophihabitantaceae bacterium]|nr:hypothetical protein [Jatrophihabitantaceae bacterium]